MKKQIEVEVSLRDARRAHELVQDAGFCSSRDEWVQETSNTWAIETTCEASLDEFSLFWEESNLEVSFL